MKPKVVYCMGASVIFGLFNGAAVLILDGGLLWAYVTASLTASVTFPVVGLLEARD